MPEQENEKPEVPAVPAFRVRHYSAAEVAELWGVSVDTVVRLFEKEAGVLVMNRRPLGAKRKYRTLRIPENVVDRVYRKLSA